MNTFHHFLLSIASIAIFVIFIGLPVYQALSIALAKIQAMGGVL